MPDCWPTVTLGEVAAIAFSGVDKHIMPGETLVRLCNYLDVYRNRRLTIRTAFAEGSATPAEIRRLTIRKGDVVITKDSETPDDIGVPSIVEDDLNGVICGYHLALLRPDNAKLAPAYLLHYLQGDTTKRHFLRTANGLTRFGLGSRAIASLPIALPPPAEQAVIARILDAVDTALERTRAAVAAAQGVRDAFVWTLLERGIGVDGRVRSDPDDTPQDYVDTRIGRVPKNWRIEQLSAVADIERGRFSPRPRNDPRYYGGPFPFIQTGQVAEAKGRVLTAATQSLNAAGKAVSREFPAGTIMVTIAANIGETAILGRPMCAPDSLVGVTVRDGHVPRYIELCLRRLRPRLSALAPRSAQANINLTFLRPLRIPVPPSDEEERIATLVDHADVHVQALEEKALALVALKKSLMHDLLTARVRVRDVSKVAAS
jgi:type I restriction enzyme S subunit